MHFNTVENKYSKTNNEVTVFKKSPLQDTLYLHQLVLVGLRERKLVRDLIHGPKAISVCILISTYLHACQKLNVMCSIKTFELNDKKINLKSLFIIIGDPPKVEVILTTSK